MTSTSQKAVLWIIVSLPVVVFTVVFAKYAGAPFVDDVPTAATKVIGSLLVVTLLTERSLAAINAAVFGKKKKDFEASLGNLEISWDLGVIDTNEKRVKFRSDVEEVRLKLAGIAGQEETVRIAVGFAFAVLISAAGVRALSALVMFDGLQHGDQKNLAHIVDILMTAGLIAGGSNGLAELLKIIKEGLKPASRLLYHSDI